MPTGIYKRTKEHGIKIGKANSISHLGMKFSKQHRDNIGKAHLGFKHTDKTKLKMSQSSSGKNNYKYRPIGSIQIRQEGRRFIKIEDTLWIAESRYLVEKYIGRKLISTEIVHHIDGDPKNNSLSNLYIFKNKGWHTDFEILTKNNIISRFVLKSNLRDYIK